VRGRLLVGLVAGAALTGAAPAAAAPTLALEAPTAQRPDAGYGVVAEARCRPRCTLRFEAHLERDGRRLDDVAAFEPFRSRGSTTGFDFWFRWSPDARGRLVRALRRGPVTMVITGAARDRSGRSRRRLRIRLARPAPARARTRAFSGRPFELPTPRGLRWVDPSKVAGLRREGDNAVLVPRAARLPRTPGYVEWDWTGVSGIARRSPGALRRFAAERVRRRFPSFDRVAIAGRRVDGGRAFRFRIPDPATRATYIVTVAFYGDAYHEVDCLLPRRSDEARARIERACRAVLDGASLRF
jgi:hypothetical protein